MDLPSCKAKGLVPGTECCAKKDNWGWRYLLFTLGGISLFVFVVRFFVFTFQESPKYLLSKGKDEEALKVLHVIAETNKKVLNITIEDFRALDNTEEPGSSVSASSEARLQGMAPNGLTLRQKIFREIKRIGILFRTRHSTRVTVLVWIIYAFDYWGFSVAGMYSRLTWVYGKVLISSRCISSLNSSSKRFRTQGHYL